VHAEVRYRWISRLPALLAPHAESSGANALSTLVCIRAQHRNTPLSRLRKHARNQWKLSRRWRGVMPAA